MIMIMMIMMMMMMIMMMMINMMIFQPLSHLLLEVLGLCRILGSHVLVTLLQVRPVLHHLSIIIMIMMMVMTI